MIKKLMLVLALFLAWSQLAAQPTLGLLRTSEEVQPGYTLFSNNTNTYLIDNCGLIVNQWQSEYRPGRALYLLGDGSLLRTAELDGAFPMSGRGGRFELFDWQGNLMWYYTINDDRKQAHHDIAPLSNGNFLCLVWEKYTGEEVIENGSDAGGLELWSEAVYEIKPLPDNQAEVVWEWHLWDHLIQDYDSAKPNYGAIKDNPRKINLNYREEGMIAASNWVHLNSISYHPDRDQILLSSRSFSEVWVIDHSTTTQEAATSSGGNAGHGGNLLYRFGNPAAYGQAGEPKLHQQHDAQWAPAGHPLAGNMLAFNNKETPNESAIKSWRPGYNPDLGYLLDAETGFITSLVQTLYSDPDLYSPFMSSVQPLANGNLLLCEADEGRFLEINGNGTIVWEYLNPVNSNGGPAAQGGEARQNQTFAVRKYIPEFPGFIGKVLEAGIPVEINPDSSDCYTPGVIVSTNSLELKLGPVPAFDQLVVRINDSSEHLLQCFNSRGRLLAEYKVLNGEINLDTSHYPSGYYLIMVRSSRGDRVTQSFVKS